MKVGNQETPPDAIGVICKKWKIRRLELFGSARTGQLRPGSNIDLLADFERGLKGRTNASPGQRPGTTSVAIETVSPEGAIHA